MNYLLKMEAPSSPSAGTMIGGDNAGMMCRDCPARGGEHGWVSVLSSSQELWKVSFPNGLQEQG